MWKYHNVEITPGKGFVDTNGVRHPSNWHIWSDEEKTKLGIKEIIPEAEPDSRLYSWTVDSDGKIQNKKAREVIENWKKMRNNLACYEGNLYFFRDKSSKKNIS